MEILQNTIIPVKKTNLLYKTRINFQQLEKYLDLLMSKGLLELISDPFNGYQITQKGMQFMELIDDTKVNTPLTLVVKPKIEKVKH
jgi:predicted transcriptional regulator